MHKMAHLKKANHGKTPMVTNSKNEIAALDSILKNLYDLGLGSEAEITPESSNFGTILNHPNSGLPGSLLEGHFS